ncbi:hypothetical protein KTC96_25085 (plasmid) [Clostridium estertheticum]|uniref:hypothetical protein n=1 Tax=Clostridium estertheticum TaxID=238834 RepID=UPI001C7CE7BE|nr:hypothetical protein [Clostridium estertheticum]MBX4262532.1 hypothetical protein [Clostridium estertheticum]WLC73350.1 hypothetical protein KTC96_25085 [Clostridium estertheticum]
MVIYKKQCFMQKIIENIIAKVIEKIIAIRLVIPRRCGKWVIEKIIGKVIENIIVILGHRLLIKIVLTKKRKGITHYPFSSF